MTENACQLVFRMLVTVFLCFVVKAVSKLLWVRCYSVKVRPCLRACALAVALLAWSGGVGVVSASHPFPLHVLYVVPMATLLCHLPIKS